MKLRAIVLVTLLFAAVAVSGCGMAKNLIGQNSGTVSDLWSDVPAPPNGSKAAVDIPLPMQILIQGFVQAANADNSNDTKLDKFDFIAYQTNQTPSQVAEFYTADKMKAAGWNSEDTPGCSSGSETSGGAGAAGFCAFGKKGDAGKMTVLLIIPYQEDPSKQTQVFFVRFEGTEKTK